jgi:hypothetical protein
MELNIEEFCEIIKFLNDKDLLVFHQVLLLEDEEKQHIYLRQNKTTLDGCLYNAYCAKVLVKDPIIYIKNEIISRFGKTI